MAKTLTIPDPSAFGLSAFADMLSVRPPIIGEEPGSRDVFHEGMTAALAPRTAYECVIAENLIAIEWELLQHRRMREAFIRAWIRESICGAVVRQRKAEHDAVVSRARKKHVASGRPEWEFVFPSGFDEGKAAQLGHDLAERATSSDQRVMDEAYREIEALGMKPIDLMSEACTSDSPDLLRHEEQLKDLERRRREVRRDFEALQKLRPIEVGAIEAEEIDA